MPVVYNKSVMNMHIIGNKSVMESQDGTIDF